MSSSTRAVFLNVTLGVLPLLKTKMCHLNRLVVKSLPRDLSFYDKPHQKWCINLESMDYHSFILRRTSFVDRELKQTTTAAAATRTRKTKDLIGRTITQHVRFKTLYIS